MNDPKVLALAPFEEHILNLGNISEFVSKSVEVQKVLPHIISWPQAWAEAKTAAQDFMKLKLGFEQTLYNSCYLSMVAGYEEFVRQIIAVIVENYTDECEGFDNIPIEISQLHLVSSARLLTRFHNPPQQLPKLNFWDVARKLGTWVPAALNVEANCEAVSLGVDLLSLTAVSDICIRFGVKIGPDNLGTVPALQTVLSIPGARNAGKEVDRFLAEMAKRRNRIAHTGSSADVTRQLFEEHLVLVRELAKAICDQIPIPVKKTKK